MNIFKQHELLKKDAVVLPVARETNSAVPYALPVPHLPVTQPTAPSVLLGSLEQCFGARY